MAPKSSATKKGTVPNAPEPSILELTFPTFSEAAIAADKEPTEKFEDNLSGLVLPAETKVFLDTWKRPEELVMNMPSIPMVSLKSPPPSDAKVEKGAPPPPPVRDFEGKMFPGHKSFEWMYQVFSSLLSVRHKLPVGDFMWELIYPKDKDGTPLKSASGRYKVRLFVMDTWRIITIDDRIPVDLFGQFLLVGTRPLQLWPLLIAKALLKVMNAQRLLDWTLPHQSTILQMLCGWPAEDLLDPLSGPKLNGGFLFDRLEDSVRKMDLIEHGHRQVIGSTCIVKRALPERPPPRIIVLAGPSAVGRSKLLKKLVEEYPDKFGLTVSHTTRRPHEFEREGRDYFFLDKEGFIAAANSGQFLEHAAVHTHHGDYFYGSSFATVREVAATGRVCLMSLDVQGVKQLQANKRIDGLYLFITPPNEEELEGRMRGRLKEHESTVSKRLLWAEAEWEKAEKTELYEHIVDDTNWDEVYYQLKEAISTLSPIIRNRLRGLPAYVLDYADLIPPNLVEKPFLKPVIVSGPSVWERTTLIEQLVKEFPDVFAIPQKTTTRPPNDEDLFRATKDEVDKMNCGRPGYPSKPEALSRAASMVPIRPGTDASGHGGGGGGSGSGDGKGPEVEADEVEEDKQPGEEKAEEEEEESIYPPDIHVSEAEFEELVNKAAGDPDWLVVHYKDIFRHENRTFRTGVSLEAIKKVIKSGKLPLMEFESDGVALLKDHNIDFLSIFIAPTSIEEFQSRLSKWLTESDYEISERMEMARAQIALADSRQVYDSVLVNEHVEDCYQEIKGLISRYRPDIILPEAERLAQEAEEAAAEELPSRNPVVALYGPPGAGREALMEALVQTFPDKFAAAGLITDRKPIKGEAPTEALHFVSAKELAKLQTDGGIVAQYQAGGANLAITVTAVEAITSKGKIALLNMGDGEATRDAVASIKACPAAKGAIIALVSSGGLSRDSESASAAVSAAEALGAFDVIFSDDTISDLVFAAKSSLAGFLPDLLSPPYRPIVVAGPFGTGKRLLLQRLFDEAPGKFAVTPVLTTRPTDPSGAEQRAEMVVISYEQAAAEMQAGNFLTHGSTMNHLYGVTFAAVKQIQGSGKVCVVECDHVEEMQKMRDSGFDALYMYLGVDDSETLASRVTNEIVGNPPLGYEVDEACALFLKQAKEDIEMARNATWIPPAPEVAEGKESSEAPAAQEPAPLVDEWVDNGSDSEAAFTRLSEALHRHYPEVIPLHFVWGYGRTLWDNPIRQYGQHTLKIMVLGPAGVGKTTVCVELAARYNIPHINVGDLIYDEVKAKTKLGLEAKVFMDASKTVPDHFFITLLTQHLATRECQVRGWLLDGFPHTEDQARTLQGLGIIPDKVVFLDGPHDVLLDRTTWRRMDYDTMKTYHVPEAGANAMSDPIKPMTKDDKLDEEVMARLQPRHDDSVENVKARLKLSDLHMPALRGSFEDTSLRVSGVGKVSDIVESISEFITLESRMPDIEVVESTSLKEIQYEIIDVLRYKRRQLARLQQDDRRAFWVDIKELVTNAHCMQLCRDIARYTESHKLRRVDLNALHRQALLMVDSPEPSSLVVSLTMGIQYPVDDKPAMGRNVLVVSGPAATGKTTCIKMLLRDYPDKLLLVPAVSTRAPFKRETDGDPFYFVDEEAMAKESRKGLLVGLSQYAGASYAIRIKDLEAAWEAGLLPVVEAPLSFAAALKAEGSNQEPPITTSCVYLTADLATLDARMRLVDKMEESAIQAALAGAINEMEAVAAGPAPPLTHPPEKDIATLDADSKPTPATSEPSLAEAVTSSLSSLDHELLLYHSVKEVAAGLWKRSRPPMPGQLILEQFSWTASKPGATKQRIRTFMASASTLELPRGRHLLRVVASSEYLHSVWFLSNSKCVADEYTKVLPQAEDQVTGLLASTYEGETSGVRPGIAALHFRYNFKVAKPITLSSYLSITGDEMHASSNLVLVDNVSLEEQIQPLARMSAREIAPNGDAGYTLMSMVHAAAGNPKKVDPLPDSQWALTLTANEAPSNFDAVPVARSQVLSGSYEANAKLVLARCLVVPMASTQLAFVATSDPPVPFKVKVLQAVTGKDVQWGQEYPTLLERSAPAGTATVYNAILPAGKYVVQLDLDNTCCEEKMQPKVVTGEMPLPVNWKVVFLPSTDEKICPILADDSRHRHLKAMMDAWSAAGTGAAPAGGKAPAAPKGGALGLNARAQAAAALLEKLKEELHSPSPPPPPSRTLKDGSTMELDPKPRLRIRPPAEEGSPSTLLTKEEIQARQVQLAEEAAKSGEAIKAVAKGLESHKAARSSLVALKASKFSEWRGQKMAQAVELRSRRAAAIEEVKAAAAAAEAEAAAAQATPAS